MPFFDKKEDVLDIKLTPYGRHLLSKGKLMPAYYSFLDEDVLYDIKNALNHDINNATALEKLGTDSEQNSEIKQRIMNDTPSLKSFYTFNSVETELADNPVEIHGVTQYTYKGELIEEAEYANIYEQNFRPTGDVNTKYLQNTLGTSQQGTDMSPTWDILFIQGEIEANNTYNFTSSLPSTLEEPQPVSVLHIPQIEFEIEYQMQVKNSQTDPIDDSANRASPEEYGNYYVDVIEEQALIKILEKNGFTHDDSFEIEVFEIEEDNSLRQLKFLNLTNRVSSYVIEKDILIEDSYQPPLEPDRNSVEYYFDLRVDEEIPIFDICQGLENLKSEGLYIQDLEIECPDVFPGTGPTISGQRSGPTDDCLDEDGNPVPCPDKEN